MAELAALRRGPARAPGVEELAGEFLVKVGALVAVRAPVSPVPEIELAQRQHLGRLVGSLLTLALHVTCLNMDFCIYNK